MTLQRHLPDRVGVFFVPMRAKDLPLDPSVRRVLNKFRDEEMIPEAWPVYGDMVVTLTERNDTRLIRTWKNEGGFQFYNWSDHPWYVTGIGVFMREKPVRLLLVPHDKGGCSVVLPGDVLRCVEASLVIREEDLPHWGKYVREYNK